MRSGLEIQEALRVFVANWRGYRGGERQEAQTFLGELFAAFGTDRRAVGAQFEHFAAGSGFMDLLWPGVFLVEMKKPGVPLSKAEDQRQRYWMESADERENIRAARFVMTCNFTDFEIWEPGSFPKSPRIAFTLEELPDHYDALLFLQSPTLEPVFAEHRRALTSDAARNVAALYTALADRAAAPIDEIQRFTMQVVWCFFAEDLGMIADYPLQATVNDLLAQSDPDSARDLGYLFRILNQKGDQNRKGRYAGTHYVNGELFEHPAEVYLTKEELRMLHAAAEFDWRSVDPTIFGSLMEGVLGPERRSRLGAHYTHEADIMKIVTPTIIRPWRERIDAADDAASARSLLDELCRFQVLDPACGCGNFLYVAYRELRALEAGLKVRIVALAQRDGVPAPSTAGVFYPLTNVHGIDIERVAVLIARVTLWMGQRQMIDRYGPAEPALPLVDLSSIRRDDALRAPWPEVDAIIGNPPFLGSQHLRRNLGDEYVGWLESRFGAGVKDLCVYWFRRAEELMRPGQRAGLVGTNSISQNRARSASLDYVVADGGVITDAVSSQKWPGEAKVHVSIVNWVKRPSARPVEFALDGVDVSGITTSLRARGDSDWVAQVLPANRGKCFQGPIPVGAGFVLSDAEARVLLADAANAEVVRPYLTSDDIAEDPAQAPSRWIVDFGIRSLEQAMMFQAPLALIRERVKPARDSNRDPGFRRMWWRFGRPRTELREASDGLKRVAAVGRHGKRMLVAWVESGSIASDATNVFAFEDDYAMGILLSRVHDAWAWAQSSTLETRLRYTPTSVFETFPWPHPIDEPRRIAVAEASAALYARRSELCREHGIGLTRLYNLLDDGAFADLADLHLRLDRAVAAAYGWPASVAQDRNELVRRLTDLNRAISVGEREYAPFGIA